MKRIFLIFPLVSVMMTVQAQNIRTNDNAVDYKYEDNAYDLQKVDKVFTRKNTGRQFNDHLNAFRKISAEKASAFVNISDYKAFLGELERLSSSAGDALNTERTKNFVAAIKTASTTNIADPEYRNRLYKTAYPIKMAIGEEWGDDILDVALSDAWSDLGPYIASRGKTSTLLADVATQVNEHMTKDIALMAQNKSGDCVYHVKIDKAIRKDEIRVFFCEQRLANEINRLKLYPEDRLLDGPIAGYEAMADESANLLHFLGNNTTYKMYSTKVASPKDPSSFDQQLDNNTEWYLYAFRNGKLYYSYMALPCSHLNTCTLKELPAPVPVPNGGGQL